MKDFIQQSAFGLKDYLSQTRRHLHAHPELSFQEYETMAFVSAELKKIGIPFEANIAGTGIVALIEGKHPERNCIALRADMDALPITEQNEVAYKSTVPGVMHACGHDVHTSCLLGAAHILNDLKHAFEGTVKLIFQPGEEQSPGGASLMIKAGVLENPKPKAIIGLHVFPELPSGTVAFRSGQYMASADEIHITIKGKGGHAALPHKTIDPITIAANLIMQLQQLVSRRCNPLLPTVLTFGKIAGGQVTNVIPESVEILGTLRTFDETWRKEALSLIEGVCTATATAWGATARVHFPDGYPSLFNDPVLHKQTKHFATDYLGTENVGDLEMRMTAEDFSFYTQEIPGCFYRLGTNKNNETFLNPVHNDHFDIDETALITGSGLMAWMAYRFLNGAE
ncbi:M20 family metallopeptidase [Taibaiella sp. KBW10]|uniref:M20 metallopeptidase family protein n=1 Tax=Taibaiella sp. KBW10 TaxID=2153357 RepID=UPI001F3ED876|nr:M20 family metallopeptidase [Taibaiella sp. KBW10]